MQIFDKKYRLFGVINIIDLLVVIALLVGGLVVYRLLWGGPTAAVPAANLRSVEYTILCSPLRNYKEGQIRVGDPVSTRDSGESIGKVVSVTVNPTPGDIWSMEASNAITYDSTFFTDVFIKVKAEGELSATGISVGNTQIHSNEVLPIVTPTFQCDTAILSDFKIGGE